MKNILYTFILCTIAITAHSQDSYHAENPGWLVDLDEAYQESEKTGKPIMANFTGSDWCGWCKRLTAAVFSKDQFKSWAEDNVVLLELDFPRRKQIPEAVRRQNAGLQQVFKVRGFPTVWIFDLDKNSEGKYQINAFGKSGYKPSVKEFTDGADRILVRANQVK